MSGNPAEGPAEPGRDERGRDEPGRDEPGRDEPGQVEPGRGDPGWAESGRAEPGQAGPGQTGPGGLGGPGAGPPRESVSGEKSTDDVAFPVPSQRGLPEPGDAGGEHRPPGDDVNVRTGRRSKEAEPEDPVNERTRSIRSADDGAYGLLGVASHSARTHRGDNVTMGEGSGYAGRDQYNGGQSFVTDVAGDHHQLENGDVVYGGKTAGDEVAGDKVAGDKHSHVHYGGGRPDQAGRMPEQQLTRVLRTHVGTPGFNAVLERLRADRLVVLRGPRNTGRHHTAVAALALGPNSGGGVYQLPGAFEPGPLPADPETEGMQAPGYFLDATGRDWMSRPDLAAAGVMIAELVKPSPQGRRPSMVVIADEEDVSDIWRPYLVEHVPPPALEVLRRHLHSLYSVTDPEACIAEARRAPDVAETLDRMSDPWDAAAQAEALGAWEADGRRGRPGTRRARERALRASARELLAGSARAPKVQGFVLAASVLDGEAENDVIIAARDLTGRLRLAQSHTEPAAIEVFGEPVRLWFPHADVAVPTLELENPQAVPVRRGLSGRPRVALREPMLAGSVLEIAWSDYEETRDPVCTWLESLCQWPDVTVRQRAAYAAARLASLDFSSLEEMLLRPWADSGRAALVQATGRALEGIVLRGDSAVPALRLLTRWSRGGSAGRAVAVLQAYGGPIGQERPGPALRAVDDVLARDAGLGRYAQWTLAQMFRFGAGPEVVEHLTDWQKKVFVVREQACGAFTQIVLQGRETASGRLVPEIAALVRERRLRRSDVVRLWTGALRSRTYGDRAWSRLRVWSDVAHRAGPADQLETETLALVRSLIDEVGQHPDLRHRMRDQRDIWTEARQSRGTRTA
ncbi:hypothetical protein KIH74_21330 [Kineosporia sp. J2-2]|uniref:HEAT repeat protein n=1 Tax=Kineosporia corallincola TaxID=2835133 RepID=A0ABS5TM93_9ACTN|nr:hypothetical protein [Kineosporia corallincola]MBT0771494.1 hypothetical protein [Kineosporia corallincola]